MKRTNEGERDTILPHARLGARRIVAGACLGAAALLGVTGAAAMAHPGGGGDPSGSPHFIKNATTASLSGADLVVAFKEAGLPSGQLETITSSATASTTYECVNNGDKHPQASNKITSVTQTSFSGTFPADKNGNVESSETLSAPTAGALGFTCPPGQDVTFVGVSYSDVSISDSTSGATLDLPGTFAYTNPDAPACRNNCS